VGIKINQGRKGAEDTFDFLSAGRNLLLGKSIERQGLVERADMCRAISPLERVDHGVRTGCEAIVSLLGEGPRVAFSSDYRAEHAQTCHAGHSTHHVVQGQIPLGQRLGHGLNMFDRPLDPMVSMAEATAELADVPGGRNDGANNPERCNFGSHRQSKRSVFGRPGTFLTWRALTRAPAKPRAARMRNSSIQSTPVDASTTVGIR